MGLPRVPPEMFRFAASDRAELHTAVLCAFGDAAGRLEPALTVDQVRERVRTPLAASDELASSLKQLVQWQLLDVVFDHSGSFATAEEYERKNLLYSLTRQGEAAYAGVQHALAVFESAGALQTAVLDAVAERLHELDELLSDPDPGRDRRIFTALSELEGHLDELQSRTQRFNNDLHRLLRTEEADPATFHEAKTATVTYLQEFVTDLDRRASAIAVALRVVASHDVRVLRARALAGADLPFAAGRGDGEPAAAETRWLADRAARWDVLRAWFALEEGHEPRVQRLHETARQAIVALLQVLDRIADSRRRPSGAAADFRALARWFAAAPGEADAHRLWSVAFGLGPAVHAHLGYPDADLIPAGTSWRRAAPVEVSALLRAKGRTERMGRPGRVRDVSELRAERRRRAARERAELETAWAALATTGTVRLSSFGSLDHDTFGRLLDLLGRALAERADSTGTRRAVTSDGRVEIVLREPDDGGFAEITTSEGRFRAPDYGINVRTLGRVYVLAEGA